MNAILSIDPPGAIAGLDTELIELHQLGPLKITRATTIEFNPSSQQWEVRDTENVILFRNPSRFICLAWQQQQFHL